MPFKDKEKARENQRERNRRYRAKHPVISAERRKADYYRDLEKSRERARKWYWANREKALAAANERSQRVRYQVPQVLLDMLGNACKICGATEANKKGYKLHIDHDHETGTIRGKLCHGCNSGIGYFKESPELLRKAADYLEWAARV